jgi:3,4-dihydroxy 2-butanone 4-phosphate synthase/GTP cyclohydrolase II
MESLNRVSLEAVTTVPTAYGELQMRGYIDNETGAEHVALVSGCYDPSNTLVRIHSECITGEAFGSLKCECGPQLHFALEQIAEHGGVVIYLRGQEGRGIGLLNKLKAYALQEQGLDTVDANLALGLPDEAREYGAAISILDNLGIRGVTLLSNNPEKADCISGSSVELVGVMPILVGVSLNNINYLETKRDRMSHYIDNLPQIA